MDKYTIPKHLDAPVKILFFTVDEFFLSIIPGALLIFLGLPMLAIAFLTLVLLALKKIKGEQGLSYLKAVGYWFLPRVSYFYVIPPSYQRFYLG